MLSNSKSNCHCFERERLNLIPVLMLLGITLVNSVLKTNHTIAVFFCYCSKLQQIARDHKLKNYSLKQQQIIILHFRSQKSKMGLSGLTLKY